jgi:hypothetical protein
MFWVSVVNSGGTYFSLLRLEESLIETGGCPSVLDILPKE